MFDPVKYIREPLTMAWPVVMENPSPIDPFDFNGAIEPFSLRRPLAGFSTFLGSSEDPGANRHPRVGYVRNDPIGVLQEVDCLI